MLTMLNTFVMYNVSVYSLWLQFNIEVLHELAMRCHNLVTLNLSGLEGVEDTVLVSLAEHCPSLTKLHLKGCKQVSDAASRAVNRSVVEPPQL